MAARQEILPEGYQRVKLTGMLRVCMRVRPDAAKARLPEPHTNKSYLIHHFGTADLRVAQWIDDEQDITKTFRRMIREAQPKPTRPQFIPPSEKEIDRIAANFAAIASKYPDTLMAQLKGLTDVLLSRGKIVEVDIDAPPAPLIVVNPGYLSFEDAITLWANERKPAQDSIRDARAKFKYLRETLQHDDASHVTDKDIIIHKDRMVAEEYKSKTIGNHLKVLKIIFDYLKKNKKIIDNPFAEGIGYIVKRDPKTERMVFDEDDRADIYTAAIYETTPLYKWFNLLLLFHGMRPEEIAEMDTRNVRQIRGVWCMLFNYDYKTQDNDQQLKTDASIRRTPIHQAVLDAGFLKYVRSLPPGPLFPTLRPDQDGRLAGDASRKIGDWLREVAKISERRKVNYSHRDTVITAMCDAGVRETTAQYLVGHSLSGVHARYNKRGTTMESLEALKRDINTVAIPVLRGI